VKFQAVPSGMQTECHYQYLVSYIVNEHVAIDAGSLGFGLPLADQKKVTDVFLSHCHLDHVASLPILLDSAYEYGPKCVTVHGSSHALSALQTDLLNNRTWPDFVGLSTPENPFVTLHELAPCRAVMAGQLTVTAVELQHVVPTQGFIITDGQASIAVISDTLHGTGVLSQVARAPNLKAVFLECSFPNHLKWLADKAMHLIPSTFATEIALLPTGTRVIAIHIKPAWHDQVVQELRALDAGNLEIGEIGKIYEF
jgi:ribonuclease BN (tRNA processing enzyme)